jgi:hypothetical protein
MKVRFCMACAKVLIGKPDTLKSSILHLFLVQLSQLIPVFSRGSKGFDPNSDFLYK